MLVRPAAAAPDDAQQRPGPSRGGKGRRRPRRRRRRGPPLAVPAALAAADYKIVDWHCKGQPGPDFISGSVDVAAGDVGRASDVLVKAGGKLRVNWEVFPNGIPFPDIYRIKFNAGPGA